VPAGRGPGPDGDRAREGQGADRSLMTQTRPTPIVACLAGDGIGPEVMAEAGRVIETVSELFGIRIRQVHLPFGGEAIDRHNDPFPAHVRPTAEASGPALLSSV